MKIQNLFSSDGTGMVHTNCVKCGLNSNCKSPLMPVSGEGNKSILIVGESPGKMEDTVGAHWKGQSGQELRNTLALHDIDLSKDCWSTNALCCFSAKKPTKKQIKLCHYKFLKTVEEFLPEFIIPLGTIAVQQVLSAFSSKVDISKLHGKIIPIKEYHTYILPLYHPSYIIRNDKDKNLKSMFNRDVKHAVDFINSNPTFEFYNLELDDCHLLTKVEDVKVAFKKILSTDKPVAIDYETTGLKPFVDGHKITSMAISTEFGTFAFPVDYQNHWNDYDYGTVWNLICDFLESDIDKIAHNAKFEQLWSNEIFGICPNIHWCTMDTQHILDHRRGVTGLKHQAFVRWGVHNYDDSSKKYIKAEGANNFNKMDEMPLADQLLYVAIDAKLTRKLYFEQKSEMTKEMEVGRKLFRDTSEVFLDMQINGLPINSKHYEMSEKKLTSKINSLTGKIKSHPDVLVYNQNKKEFNENSSKDLQELLFKQMGFTSSKKTTGGNASVDAEVLKEIDHPITEAILNKRKYLKLRDTYLAQFKRECVDEYINPNFTLHMARSFRSSALNPSLQNIPKRDKEAKEVIRKGIVPSPGCVLMEADFSGIEVSVSALYHKDPVFINYLTSNDADMHTDLTLQLWSITKEQKTKELRFFTKNCWTFPQFYGDYFGSCAPNLWKNCVEGKLPLSDGSSLLDHLKKNKIHTLSKFTEHCKNVEHDMWQRRFKVYTQWKNDINDFYLKHGYVETYFGFKFDDYLDKKQTTNYPVQSTAAHLLFWSLIQVSKTIAEQNLETSLIGQIHDSMILDVPVEELGKVVGIISKVCEVNLEKTFDWVTIPMSVEIEVSKSFEEGGNFSDMIEISKVKA